MLNMAASKLYEEKSYTRDLVLRWMAVGLDCNALLILSALPFKWLLCVHLNILFSFKN